MPEYVEFAPFIARELTAEELAAGKKFIVESFASQLAPIRITTEPRSQMISFQCEIGSEIGTEKPSIDPRDVDDECPVCCAIVPGVVSFNENPTDMDLQDADSGNVCVGCGGDVP